MTVSALSLANLVTWSVAIAVPTLAVYIGYYRKLRTPPARARRAVEDARVAVGSAQVSLAWTHLEAAFDRSVGLCPQSAAINRDVLHQVERLVSPEIAAPVRRCLEPLDHAYAAIADGHPGTASVARASILELLIATRGEPVPAVLAALAAPADEHERTVELMPMPAAELAG